MSRLFAIGDVHGCLRKLEALLAMIDWRPEEDTLLFIGDYVDRGDESAGVIDQVINLRLFSDRIVCLMGNHEKLFLDYLEGRNVRLFLMNGGGSTLDSYGGQGAAIPESHREFLASLLPYYETESHIFVHAGLRDGVALAEQDPKDLFWIRDEFITSEYDHGKPVVFGHTPLPRPLVRPNKIGIDTGAVFGGTLTCLELPAMKFHSV